PAAPAAEPAAPATTDNSAASDGEEPAAAEPVEIVWAGWSGEEEGSKQIFIEMQEGFEAASGNNVTWVGFPWADTAQQLLIRSQGDEQLDIAQVDLGIFASLSETGELADLNEVFGKDYLEENFDAATLALGNVDGKQLALPWSMASITMVYNPEILKAAGWDDYPKTIVEFEQCLADIAAYDSSIIPYAPATKDNTTVGDFEPLLWTMGASVFGSDGSVTINGETAVKVVEWYKSLLDKNFIRLDMTRFDARQLFAQGKVAFYYDAVVAKGSAIANGVDPANISNVCSAMPLPVVNAGDPPQSTMWGHMLVLFEDSTVKEQAAELAKYLVGDAVALKYFEQNGMPPVLNSIVSSPTVQNDPYAKGFLDATKTARLSETSLLPNSSEVRTIIVEELQAAWLGVKDAQTAMNDAAARIEAVMP
ncbi:MAG: extracellular solute-binding protein, partial [Puniceicoccales bacterium]|nr:extracellular solute-binding protein [Puniceicoccales bacterium]